jgi:hypothetical protein
MKTSRPLRWPWLALSHAAVLAVGFAAGIYALPILIAPAGPAPAEVRAAASAFEGRFVRTLKDSDALHWGEGQVFVGRRQIGFVGRLSPGPDYKLYLSPEFVETEADFARLKPQMVRVGDVKTFDNFMVPVPEGVDIERHVAVIVWCETFGQFITAAKYR